jgi:outer membrane protein TolC
VRALKAAEESFRLGRANTLDVVDAQLAAERAEVSGLRERLSLDVARLRLSRALGETMFPARKRHRD